MTKKKEKRAKIWLCLQLKLPLNLELWLSSRKDIVHFVDEQKWVIFNYLKFRYSEKATKIWPSLLFLTSLSSNGIIEEVRKNSKAILFLPSEFFKNSSLQQIFQRQYFQALFILGNSFEYAAFDPIFVQKNTNSEFVLILKKMKYVFLPLGDFSIFGRLKKS